MLRLIFAFVDIAFHRRGPEHLPASDFLLVLALAASVSTGLVALLIELSLAKSLVVSGITTALDLAFFWSVLRAFSLERRFKQMMTALFGTSALLNVIVVPLTAWGSAVGVEDPQAVWAMALRFLLLVWSVDISGFVIARALDRPYPLGIAIVLGYVMLSISLQAALFPSS